MKKKWKKKIECERRRKKATKKSVRVRDEHKLCKFSNDYDTSESRLWKPTALLSNFRNFVFFSRTYTISVFFFFFGFSRINIFFGYYLMGVCLWRAFESSIVTTATSTQQNVAVKNFCLYMNLWRKFCELTRMLSEWARWWTYVFPFRPKISLVKTFC